MTRPRDFHALRALLEQHNAATPLQAWQGANRIFNIVGMMPAREAIAELRKLLAFELIGISERDGIVCLLPLTACRKGGPDETPDQRWTRLTSTPGRVMLRLNQGA